VRFDPGARIEDTNLLSRMVQTWGEIPIAFVQSLWPSEIFLRFIGMDDYTLYPMIVPALSSRLTTKTQKFRPNHGKTSLSVPIYFFQLREGYACGWCELEGKVLSIIPHSLSGRKTRQFDYPDNIDVVGRVVLWRRYSAEK